MQCCSNFLVCGTLFQTEIFHRTPPMICVGNTHKVVVVVVAVVVVVVVVVVVKFVDSLSLFFF